LSFGSTSPFFPPLLGVLLVVLVVVVIVAIIGATIAGRNGGVKAGPAAYFLFGLSLVTLATAVTTAGITVNALTQLVGPTPQSFPAQAGYFAPPCTSAPSSTTPTTITDSPTTAPSTTVEPFGPPPTPTVVPGPSCSDVIGLGGFAPSNSGAIGSFLSSSTDDSNRDISIAVAAALFGIVALVGFAFVWRRARRLVQEGVGEAAVGRLPVGYAYLVAGLAALSLLVFVPVAADSIFRAIAPGVNETSGHAQGIRDLVTFLVLSAITSAILIYHLRYADLLRHTSPRTAETHEAETPGAEPAS
jgi:hypothetical protein